MKGTRTLNVIVMNIGMAAILFGMYNLAAGKDLDIYFSPLFLGLALFGTAYINYIQHKKTNR